MNPEWKSRRTPLAMLADFNGSSPQSTLSNHTYQARYIYPSSPARHPRFATLLTILRLTQPNLRRSQILRQLSNVPTNLPYLNSPRRMVVPNSCSMHERRRASSHMPAPVLQCCPPASRQCASTFIGRTERGRLSGDEGIDESCNDSDKWEEIGCQDQHSDA